MSEAGKEQQLILEQTKKDIKEIEIGREIKILNEKITKSQELYLKNRELIQEINNLEAKLISLKEQKEVNDRLGLELYKTNSNILERVKQLIVSFIKKISLIEDRIKI